MHPQECDIRAAASSALPAANRSRIANPRRNEKTALGRRELRERVIRDGRPARAVLTGST